jgi:formate hydrogenlyase subunit 6/NADH:ubiquinone oxidoreductase subunit I
MTKALEEFRKIFPKGKEGYGKMMDGYYYIKYSRLYIYYLKKTVNLFSKNKQTLIYPENHSNPEVDEIVKLTIDQLSPELISPDTNAYHGKVIKLEDAKKLVTLDLNVTLSALPEQIMPYEKARELIIKNPDQICVIECPCRTTKENPCLPMDVCIIIGEPFVSIVMEKSFDNPRRITQEEAVSILKAEDERGHVHSAFFKDAMGDRFYCICNCCKCCCTAMAGHLINTPMLAASGYVCTINGNCDGCGICNEYCIFEALSVADEKTLVDFEKCMGCGVCESKCPNDAIALLKNSAKGKPLDIHVLIEEQKVQQQ